MKIEFLTPTQEDVKISHLDQSIQMSTTTIAKKTKKVKKQNKDGSDVDGDDEEEIVDLFAEINGYWARLPEPQQRAFFDIYVEASKIFEINYSYESLTNALYPVVTRLMDMFNLADVKHWLNFYSGIEMPAVLDNSFSEMNKTDKVEVMDIISEDVVIEPPSGKTRSRTYIKADYIELISLAIELRSMLPIWSMYIQRIKDDVGNSYKEFKAIRLLSRSHVFHSEPMERLRNYLIETGLNENTKNAGVVSGFTTSDLPDWLLGITIIRKLIKMKLYSDAASSPIIATIHNFITQKTGRDGGFSVGEVRKKLPDKEKDAGNSEQKLSVLEQYKIKQETASGDDIAMANFVSRGNIAKMLMPGISPAIVAEAHETIKKHAFSNFKEVQIEILKIVTQSILSHKGIDKLIKIEMMSLMAEVQAYLIARGHYHLAGLLTANPVESTGDFDVAMVESRGRIPKDKMELLQKYFPYIKRSSSKQQRAKQVNIAAKNIDMIADGFSQQRWELTIPDEAIVKITGGMVNRNYIVPYQIKEILADFLIDMVQEEEKRYLANIDTFKMK